MGERGIGMMARNETYWLCFHTKFPRSETGHPKCVLYVNGEKIAEVKNSRTAQGALLGYWITDKFNDRLKRLLYKRIYPGLKLIDRKPYIAGELGKKYVMKIISGLGYKMQRHDVKGNYNKVLYRVDNVNNIILS